MLTSAVNHRQNAALPIKTAYFLFFIFHSGISGPFDLLEVLVFQFLNAIFVFKKETIDRPKPVVALLFSTRRHIKASKPDPSSTHIHIWLNINV